MVKLGGFSLVHVREVFDEFGRGGFLALRLDPYLSWWVVGGVHATPVAARDALVGEPGDDDDALACVVLDLSTGTAVRA